jgi:hypothetical protein
MVRFPATKQILVFIVILSAFFRFTLMAEPLQDSGVILLEMEAGKVTLQARGADLEELLHQLSQRAGFELFIYEDIRKKVTIDINDLPLEEALKRLLPNYGFLFRRTSEGDLALRAVAVVRSRKDSGELSGGFVHHSLGRISYGDGPGEIGRINLPEVERQGPRSFAVTRVGDIYLSDTINKRVQVYGPDGKLKRSIAIKGYPTDIAVSESGDLFVLDEGRGVVLHFNPKGVQLADISVSRALLARTESFRIFGDRLLLQTRDQEEHEITSQEDGELSSGKGPFRGSRLTPDSSCMVRKVSGSTGEVTIIGRGGEVLDTIPVPVERLASIVFLGRDEEMNLYLQVEQTRPDGPGVDLGVIKLNPAGISLDKIENIPNPYASWTVRLLQVNGKGDIYQMLPGPSAVELNRWSRNSVPEKY